MAAAASRKRPASGDACPAATEASASSTSPASEGARPAATAASASSTSPASEGACPAATSASASSTIPASEGACSAATEASASSTSPASEGACPAATAASSTRPASEGVCPAATAASASSTSPASEGARPAATASRKRPAPEEACPAASPVAPKKRARYSFSKIQDYKMLNELGAGPFGVVTRARHRRTGETVAIKWICGGGGGFDAFFREAGCLAACRGHPSIVQIRDAATDAATGDLFLVMEFVGPCLRDWLTRPVSEDVARSFMRQLLSAAAKMHAAPMAMIHRDIKPENILVSDSGKLKICDFGCATPAKPAGTPYPEQWVGTLPYCAPEQLKGGRCYGSAVDMWALGCVMIEMLIGVDLFTADTEEDMLLQIKDLQEGIACIGSKAFNDLLGLSPAGIDLLAGLLSVEPDKRPTAPEALAHRWFTKRRQSPLPQRKQSSPALCHCSQNHRCGNSDGA